ncbi:hypothetical protein CW735_13670 [Alteromonas sp. MB-3u-76]|uniref:hypothetical protein n=1 Tax=Alteromonas sp. MB-3u-76 TaxID=2058133 RepID=UPI000C31B4D4|nr:hypothetical protein [Alteromonas sp. MB-3u-76]AUC89097.1 hypothetical protein CW735_13670 [Alteromonas sp. MB-3u-76]
MLKLHDEIIYALMPDFSGIIFFIIVSGETVFVSHSSVKYLVVRNNKVDWEASNKSAKKDPLLTELLAELKNSGFLTTICM